MRFLRPLLGFAISAVALLLLAEGTDWRAVGRGIRDANPALIAVALVLMMILFVVRAHRWRLFFPRGSEVDLWPAFKALNIGYMAGNILPLQMGEIARVYALGESTGQSKAKILSTVGVERVLDLALLLIAALILGPSLDLPAPATLALLGVVVVLLCAVAAVLIAVVNRPLAERISGPLIRLLPARLEDRLLRIRGSMLDGVGALADLRQLATILLWTAIAWALSAAVIYVLLRAMHVDAPITAAPFLLITTTLAFLLPSSPGAVGVYDAVAVTSLVTAFDVDRDHATSYALVAHASYLIPPTIMGAIFWWSMNFRLPRPDAGLADIAGLANPEDSEPPQPASAHAHARLRSR